MIKFSCEACGAALRLPDCFSGQRGRCPCCRGTIGIPKAGENKLAPRLCNSCGSEVSPEDLQCQGIEEVFCKGCMDDMARRTDSTILREVGLEIPGMKVIRGGRQEREATRSHLDPKARKGWKDRIFRKAGRRPPKPEEGE